MSSFSVDVVAGERGDDVDTFAYAASFSGCDVRALQQQSGGDDALRVFVYANKSERKAQQRVLVAETDHVHFEGTNVGPANTVVGKPETLLCLVDRKSGRVTATTLPHLFRMQPTPKRSRVAQPPPPVTPTVPAAAAPAAAAGAGAADKQAAGAADSGAGSGGARMSYEQRQALVTEFGTKKNRQVLHSRELNRAATEQVSISDDVASRLQVAAQKQPEISEAADTETSLGVRYVEPSDEGATDPALVYNLADLVPESLHAHMEDKRIEAASHDVATLEQLRASNEYAYTTCATLSTHQHLDRRARVRMCKQLFFFECLLRFARMSRRIASLEGVAEKTGIPEPVLMFLLERFTEVDPKILTGTVYLRTPVCEDKLIAHMIVLAVQMNEHAMGQEPLTKDLKMTTTKLRDYARAVGIASIPRSKLTQSERDRYAGALAESEVGNILVLKAPLKIAPPPRGKARK